MTAESIWFTCDADGNHHLPFDALPYRVVVDPHGLGRLPGVKVAIGDGRLTIECDGRTLIYNRVGITIEGKWVCNLQLGDGNDGIAS